VARRIDVGAGGEAGGHGGEIAAAGGFGQGVFAVHRLVRRFRAGCRFLAATWSRIPGSSWQPMWTTLATLLGAATTVLVLVLLLAGSPNSRPEQWRTIKLLLLVVAAVGVTAVLGAIATHRAGRTDLAPWVGVTPLPFAIALGLIASRVQA